MNCFGRLVPRFRILAALSLLVGVSSICRATTVATPTLSPAAGGYTGTQSVTISDTTSGATIYYTTNGTTPSSSSTRYTAAISVSASETIKAIAEKSGDTNSAVASAAYTITMPTPAFSLAAGGYTGIQSVTLSDATSGATIYYTTNGTTPTSSSTQYTAAISVSTSETIKAIAELSGDTNSTVASAAYTITVPTPTFSPTAGTYSNTQSVTISDATSGATCYYTLTAGTTGTTPTTSSTQYSTAISVTATSVLESLCAYSGDTNSAVGSAAYTLQAATPTFSPAAGTYTTAQTVTISDATSGSTTYYTTNGSTPTTSSTRYTSPITVNATETVKAIAAETGYTTSSVGSAAYTINLTVATPTFSPAAGTYTSPQTVTISDSTSGSTIYYTTNGSTPTTSSTQYTTPITVSATETVKAIGVETGYANSSVASAAYTINLTAATPTFSPAAGTYTSAQTVTISDATSGSTIYYTTNGSTPTTSSTAYSGAITVSSTETVKAIAIATGYSQSAVGSAAYTISPPAAPPTFSVATGTYTSTQTVTLSDTSSGVSIYYTLDGSTPTTSSTLYGGAITVSATTTIEAIASGGNYSPSPVASATYTIVPPGTVGTLQVFISPPDAESTTVTGALTETFDALTPAIYTSPYVSSAGLGTYTGSSTSPIGIVAPNQYGGATDSQNSSATNYFGVGVESGSTSPVTLTLTHPAAYFGFWWSAGDAYNRVALYSGGTLYGTFSTADLLSFLNNGVGTITAGSGGTYQTSSYFGNPNITSGSNDSGEPFAYVSFEISNTTIDQIVFYNLSASTGFESDNHSAIFSGNTVTIPSTYAPVETLTLGSQAAQPVFTPAAGTYSSPQTVTITTTTAGASINYTTDGSTPSPTHGTTYTAPVAVSQTETIQAIAYETGLTSSNVISSAYTLPISVSVSPTAVTLQQGGVQQFSATLTNTSNTAVNWTISPAGVGTIGSSGLYTAPSSVASQQQVTVTATSQADTSKVGNATVTLLPPVPPTITFTVSNQTYGVAPFTVSATSNSPGAITYSVVSGPATVSGSTVTITGAGNVILQASQAASGNYTAGTQNASFTVAAEAPTITFTVSNQTYGVTPFTVSATSNSPGAFTYSVISGPATISGSTVTITGVGTVVLQASQSAGGNYTAGTQNASFAVAAEAPTITFTGSNQTYGVAPFAVSATSNSSGTITYSVVSGPATISGSTVTITGVGTVVLQASQAASGNYIAGTQNASFTVAAEAQTITFTAPESPVTYGVAPIMLSASASSGLSVTFSVVSGPGTVSVSTLTITGPGTVVVAADQPGNTDYSAAPEVTQSILVNPAVSISVTPLTASLSAGQTQQFTATVTNASNTGLTWTISPAGVGTIGSSGLYTAPSTVASQQQVTVTATSQADQTKSASATITLTPPPCISNGFSYVRAITIDHTKVPNTDQMNFPFLFNTTDPLLATAANGGHVANANGYDIIFTSDAAGQNPLPYEMEEYNPATGQVVAWVQIPDLTHASDTVIYLFYGNPAISASQQNPTAVWDSNYLEVLHMNGDSGIEVQDSTANGNNGTKGSATSPAGATTGSIANSDSFDGSTGYIVLPPSMTTGLSTFSASLWIQTTDAIGNATYWNQPSFFGDSTNGNASGDFGVTESGGDLGMWSGLNSDGDNSFLTTDPVSDGHWHRLDAVNNGTTISLYLDGSNTGQSLAAGQGLDTYGWYLGAEHYYSGGANFFIQGNLEEFHFSNITRSAGWIATEFANQGSPATFYALTQENVIQAVPAAVSLLPSQSQQFGIPGVCSSTVAWSMPNNSPGTLSNSGLYTAPASIAQQQTVTITGETPSSNSTTATVTLVPQVLPNGGPAGTVVTINGDGFGSAEGPSSVTVGGLPAVTLSWSNSQIQAQIPTGTGLGIQNVVVTVGGQTLSSAQFNVVAGITGITPPLNSITGVPASATINVSGQQAPLIFYGSKGQIASAQIGNDTLSNWGGSVNITILKPDGTTLGTSGLCIYLGSGCTLITNATVLPESGIYTLLVDPYGATGSTSLTFWLFNNQTGTLKPGIPLTQAVNIPAQEAVLTFNGIASQSASVQISNDFFNSPFTNLTLSILNPDGTTLVSSSLCGNPGIGCILATTPQVLQQTGIYTVVITPERGGTGSITLLLSETTSFTINPASVTLWGSQAQQFTTTFNGDTDSEVNWTLTPATGAGILSSDGLYTAPTSISTQQTATVTATSLTVPPQSVSATVTLVPRSFIVLPSSANLYSGQTQSFTLTCAASCPASVSWSMSQSGLGSLTQGGLNASYTAPANITAQQSLTITATDPTNNTQSSALITLMPPAQGPTLLLSAAVGPPYVVGASQQFFATLKNRDGTPLAGGVVTFNVAGANNNSGSGITDNNGTAAYVYTGSNSGTDIVQAQAAIGGEQTTSNAISAIWIVPAQPISTTTVTGMFFTYDGSPNFDRTPADKPAFTQSFPTLIFNPEEGTVSGNTSGVTNSTLPFTNIVTDARGNFAGTIVAQGNGYQAGCGTIAQNPSEPPSCTTLLGNMFNFQAVFSGSFVVASAGNVTFTYYDDDLFTLGIGNGATAVSGPTTSFEPSSTPFFHFPSMGSNLLSIDSAQPIVVNFPAPGTYPFEIDYAQSGGGALGLYITASASTTGIAPTASITLSPGSVAPQPLGGNQQFTAVAIDAIGNPVPNLNVNLTVTFADNLNLIATTNASGVATFNYQNQNPGVAVVQATALIDGMIAYSNTVSVPWTQSSSTGTGGGTSGSLTVSASGYENVVLPNSLQLSGSATDTSLPAGDTIEYQWSQLSGPGAVSFASNAQQASPTAAFTQPGVYQLQLTATEVNTTTLAAGTSASAQVTVDVSPQPTTSQGWIGSPQNGAQVSGIVPIAVVSGETLTSCALSVYPAANPSAITAINCNTTSGTSQIATWDTTSLNNGTYWIALQATDSSGNSSYNLALVTVVGNYKPGRVTSTVTDLVVPSTGLAINIQRTYDSLNAAVIGDFGYGWNLGINVNLVVDNKGNVTFTLGGQRKTFYLTPEIVGCSPLIGCPFSWYSPVFAPEPGLHGTLTDSSPGCPLDVMLADGECEGGGYYNPPGYIYTDPNGTQYTISAGGQLQSIVDRSGNGLTITANGITSTTGLNVPFVRDSQGRITQITDTQGNVYLYGYDANGNLATVTYPNTSQPSTYTYSSNHYYLSGTDFRSNPLPTTAYYAAGEMDASGNYSVAGKLQSVTDGLGETTSYVYNLSTNTTTVTYPPDASGNVGHTTMVYDGLGDLLTSTDPLNNTTTNTYDANQNLLSTTDPLGNTTTYTYDANGNKTSQTYPAAATSTNTTSTTDYNQYSEPTQTTDEDGNTRTFNYDANYNPASVTDSLGTLMSTQFNSNQTLAAGAIGYDITSAPARASQFTYDANGNLASKTDALGRTTSYTYNALGQKVTMIEPIPAGSNAAAATTTYQYDAFGDLTQTSAPLGRVTSSQYDGNGNKTSDTDARSNPTTYQYDNLNRLILTTYPDTTTASKTYDFRNNVIRETDQGGHVTLHQYDLSGRQVAVTQAYGTSNATTTIYAYDNAGRKTSDTDALSHTTSYSYDNAGNLTAISGVKGNFQYAYDNARNQISVTDGNNNATHYAYDARKRLTVTTYPDQTTKTNAYDGPGNLASVTDQAQNVVQYTYDAANQLASVIQASSPNTNANTTVYGYDANGNPITLEDANTHTTQNYFDVLSELTSKTLPDATHTETRTYDSNGNLSSVTHFNGTTTTYTYDTLNRLLSRATPGETTVSFTYTATGKRATMTDASGVTNYTYDSMDRLSSKATPEGTLSYTYDAAGNLASMSSNHTHGVSVTYGYDDLNRLASAADANLGGSGTTSYAYDNASNVGTVTYPNGVTAQFTYDLLNRVAGLSSQVSGYTYQRGPTGNLTSAAEQNGRAENWNYDGIYRLTSEAIRSAPSGHNGSVSYSLDPVGNRLSEASSLNGIDAGSWSFNPDDEVSSENYDANGNVSATDGKSFAYDSENHLMSMGNTVSLLYDGDGNRVGKSVNGVSTYFLVDDLNPTGYPQVVEELSGTGIVQRQYTYGLQRISENQPISNDWTASFYGYDGGSNVRQLTNAAGTVTDTYEYDAFGNSYTTSGSTPNEFLYRGEQYDSDLGLYYLRARYYNPLTGRFMSRDPEEGKVKNPRTLHKYLYASGDPLNRFDPAGRADLVEVDLENAEIGFSSHGLDALTEQGLELSEPEVEQYIEEVVREYIAEVQESGGTLGIRFDLMFTMDILDNIPWAARVFIVAAADIRISTYFQQLIP